MRQASVPARLLHVQLQPAKSVLCCCGASGWLRRLGDYETTTLALSAGGLQMCVCDYALGAKGLVLGATYLAPLQVVDSYICAAEGCKSNVRVMHGVPSCMGEAWACVHAQQGRGQGRAREAGLAEECNVPKGQDARRGSSNEQLTTGIKGHAVHCRVTLRWMVGLVGGGVGWGQHCERLCETGGEATPVEALGCKRLGHSRAVGVGKRIHGGLMSA